MVSIAVQVVSPRQDDVRPRSGRRRAAPYEQLPAHLRCPPGNVKEKKTFYNNRKLIDNLHY